LGSDQHLLAAYGQSNDSWTLGYNLFADVWLGTNLVEQSVGVLECSLHAVSDQFQVYNGHSNFINNLVSNSNFSKFGMPIDNAVPTDTSAAVSSWYLYASYILSLTPLSLGWSLFVAAMTTNEALRSALIANVYNETVIAWRLFKFESNPAFAVYYDSASGTPLQGVYR
jgi:hypothetical protein